MLDALLNILNGFTDIPFVELAWSHSPDSKYGVINLDTQVALNADEDPVSEKMLTGFVDVFVRKPNDLSTVSDVESAMKRLGIWFALNSVQFEDDTGYMHYEWSWKDTNGNASAHYAVIKFVVDGQTTEAWLPYGATPAAPTLTPYWDGTVSNRVRMSGEWDKPVTDVNGNSTYTAVWYALSIIETGVRTNGYNVGLVDANGEPRALATFSSAAFEKFTESFATNGCKLLYLNDVDTRYTLVSLNGTEGMFYKDGEQKTVTFQVHQ